MEIEGLTRTNAAQALHKPRARGFEKPRRPSPPQPRATTSAATDASISRAHAGDATSHPVQEPPPQERRFARNFVDVVSPTTPTDRENPDGISPPPTCRRRDEFAAWMRERRGGEWGRNRFEQGSEGEGNGDDDEFFLDRSAAQSGPPDLDPTRVAREHCVRQARAQARNRKWV
jgi:hypothetical protein